MIRSALPAQFAGTFIHCHVAKYPSGRGHTGACGQGAATGRAGVRAGLACAVEGECGGGASCEDPGTAGHRGHAPQSGGPSSYFFSLGN